MDIIEKQYKATQQLLRDLDDVQDRLEFFVEEAKSVDPLPEHFKVESFRVKGCISNLWIVPSFDNGKCKFACDGDAVIPKGVALVLLSIFDGASPDQIVSFDKSRLQSLGLNEVLSTNRRNALSHVFDFVLNFAMSVVSESSMPRAAVG